MLNFFQSPNVVSCTFYFGIAISVVCFLGIRFENFTKNKWVATINTIVLISCLTEAFFAPYGLGITGKEDLIDFKTLFVFPALLSAWIVFSIFYARFPKRAMMRVIYKGRVQVSSEAHGLKDGITPGGTVSTDKHKEAGVTTSNMSTVS